MTPKIAREAGVDARSSRASLAPSSGGPLIVASRVWSAANGSTRRHLRQPSTPLPRRRATATACPVAPVCLTAPAHDPSDPAPWGSGQAVDPSSTP